MQHGVPEKKKPETARLWLELFWTFFKIGALTLGGGYAMLPLIYHEVVERRRWLDRETFFAGTALAQGLPGANAVNTAVFVGYRQAGLGGAGVAALGSVVPSFIIILALGLVIFRISALPAVADIFQGLRAGILGMLLYYLGTWSRALYRDFRSLLILGLALYALLVLQWHPIAVIICGGLLGLLLSAGNVRVEPKEGEKLS
ncbi:MAG: chromate transporter [Bacillota bacterium]|nr:chromate transporter [Bacillota bacterium]